MTSVDLKAMRAITQELTSLKISNSDGQSISKIVKLITSTLGWLTMTNMTPPDIFTIIYNILETFTVPNFLLFLKTLTTNAMLYKHKFWLLSKAHSSPIALNANISREDFDTIYIAALHSGGNREGLVEIVLDSGCTHTISPNR
jgi:hypothetical protein